MASSGERVGAGPNDVDGGDPAATSQTTRALLSLRELLLSGEFPSGTRMSELPLVERLGVSRTPLRLALATLEHEGLLEMLPGGGYAVREFTRDDVHDAIELRGVLEGTAARFAAERGASPEQLTEMRELSAQMERMVHRDDEDSFWRYVELNARFHALLLEAAASPVLARSWSESSPCPLPRRVHSSAARRSCPSPGRSS